MRRVTPSGASLVDEARRFVGTGPPSVRAGRDPVNRPMIHHWCDAIGDGNPAYLDETRPGGIIAPPALLGSWTLDSATPREDGGPRDQVLRRIERAGYTSVVATNYEQEYLRELRPGDRLVEEITVEDISDRKDTGLGTGYFVTVRHDYRDEEGELVGVARMRLLKFQPRPRPAQGSREGDRPRPPVGHDNRSFWEGVEQGELRIQRCGNCGRLRHPPRPMCGDCQSTDADWVVAAGRGTVHSYAVHHHPPLPGIELPHIVVLVDLDEGVRIVSELVDVAPDEVEIGIPVAVSFDRLGDDLVLPRFRRRQG